MKILQKTHFLSALLIAAGFFAPNSYAASPEQSLVVCTEASPEGFDIAQYTAATTADASAETVFDRLVNFAPGSTELIPGLAESWEISEDGLTYTLHLRRGVKFHNSKAFTPTREFNAEDVLWSFQRQLDPQHPWHKLASRGFPYAESMGMAALIERIEAPDAQTVVFTLKHPEAPFLADLAMGFASIYSAEYAATLLASGNTELLNQQPIGTGPFVFERYSKDAQVRFNGNPDYWDGAPKLARLIFAITPDPNVRLQRLKADDCQVAVYPRPTDIPALRDEPELKVLELDSLLIAYLGINTRHPPLDDLRVRQAINMAFDKAVYVRAQFGEGGASPAVAPYPPTLWGSDPSIADWPHDLQRAKQLLKDAGQDKGFNLTIWTRPGGGPTNPNPGIGAQLLQDDLGKLGIKATIRVYEWGELLKRAKNGEHDLIFMGWAGDNGDPDNFLTPNLSCTAARSGENLAGWCNTEFDALITQARGSSDQTQRAVLYRKALAIFHEQAPWIPLAHPKQFSVIRRDVQNFVLSPMGSNNFAKVQRHAVQE